MNLIREFLERRKDLADLAKAAKFRGPVYPCPLVVSDSKAAIWEIVVPGMKPCYMQLKASQGKQESYVVRVDGDKFFRAWLTGSGIGQWKERDACEPRHRLSEDHKYRWPAEHFPQGISNPVPLADSSINRDSRGKLGVSFTDGVTRTKWLIANRAESFPVHVRDKDAAVLLNSVAGLDSDPIPVSSLFQETQILKPAPQVKSATPKQSEAPTKHRKRIIRL